jgi:hypothetical protein
MTQYRANAPRFVDETVDGEALIMDMVKGTYYSCVGASTVVYNGLKHGWTAEEAAAALCATFELDPGDAKREVEDFLEELLREEVLVVGNDVHRGSNGHQLAYTGAFEPLRLERYTDLADLILLDPVHDVSDAGWPSEPS